MPHIVRLAAALLLTLSGIAAARANDVQIAAFFGRYEGTAIVEKLEGLYFGITARDIDVEIGPTGTGFYVQWTSVDRNSADHASQSVRRLDQRVQFVPGGHSGTYGAIGPDAKVGGAFTWATISGQSLRINLMREDESGGIELQTYERILTELGLALEFSRVRDAEQVLFLRGRMIKVAR